MEVNEPRSALGRVGVRSRGWSWADSKVEGYTMLRSEAIVEVSRSFDACLARMGEANHVALDVSHGRSMWLRCCKEGPEVCSYE